MHYAKKISAIRPHWRLIAVCMLGLALLLSPGAAFAGGRTAPSGSSISGDIISAGGGVINSGSGSINGTVGQVVAGRSTASSGAVLYHGVHAGVSGAGVPGLMVQMMGPSTVEKAAGDSHTFEVSVSGGTGTITYQWLYEAAAKVFQPIPGAESATYTIAPLAPSDSGSYKCEVSDNLTTVQSSPVELTVTATGMSLFKVPRFRDLAR